MAKKTMANLVGYLQQVRTKLIKNSNNLLNMLIVLNQYQKQDFYNLCENIGKILGSNNFFIIKK